ncbi:LysR family transcriptional regulator [Streptomyces sp. NPDC048489]|uniref:helix-turn-helix domain-containing protein n=1 Tax=Streptomyces sp. NPDC048489 TaxID=3154504 RepID=UPI003432126F
MTRSDAREMVAEEDPEIRRKDCCQPLGAHLEETAVIPDGGDYVLDSKQVEALQAVARTGSLTHAADMLGMTPLAVCRQLAEVESMIGEPVLQPYGRTIRLTRVALLFWQNMNRTFSDKLQSGE